MATFRFLFSEEFMERLTDFSKSHRDDNRKLFKGEWNNWISQEETKKIIEIETQSLRDLGFTGDVYEKMFMSARYYFRKKVLKTQDESFTKPEKIRKQYTTLDKHILDLIDTNIEKHTNSSSSPISPSDSYEAFCQDNKETITKYSRQIIEDLTNQSQREDAIRNFITKIKKSYKNRYYKKIVQQKIEN